MYTTRQEVLQAIEDARAKGNKHLVYALKKIYHLFLYTQEPFAVAHPIIVEPDDVSNSVLTPTEALEFYRKLVNGELK